MYWLICFCSIIIRWTISIESTSDPSFLISNFAYVLSAANGFLNWWIMTLTWFFKKLISLFLFLRSNSIETHLAKDIESAFNLESRDTGQLPPFKSVSTLRTPSRISFSWRGYHLLFGEETFSAVSYTHLTLPTSDLV